MSRDSKSSEELPRGVFRRGNSLGVCFADETGKIHRRLLGMVTPKFAEEQRAIFKRQIAEGRYIKKAPRVESVSFRQIADKAIEHAKSYKRAWDADEGRLNLMKTWWGDRAADSIAAEEINTKLLQAKTEFKWTETTSNEYRVTLSHTFRLAIDRGELTVNPAQKAHRYKLNNQRTRELTYKEEDLLRKAIRELYPEKEPEFDLAIHTGVRRSNLYGIHNKKRRPMAPLDWSNVDLDWKVLRLPRSKAGPGYVVPLNQTALSALSELRQRSDGTGPVIRKLPRNPTNVNGEPATSTSGREVHSCRRWFEKCVDKAGLPDFRYHDLRHTFATRLRRNGVALEDIARLLDHGIPELRMTLRYAHADMDRLYQAVATLVRTDTKTDTSTVVEFPKAEAV